MNSIKTFFAKDWVKILLGGVFVVASQLISLMTEGPTKALVLNTWTQIITPLAIFLGITSGGTSSLRSNASNNATTQLVDQGLVTPVTSAPKPAPGFVRLVLLVVLAVVALLVAGAARAQTSTATTVAATANSPTSPIAQPKFGGCLNGGGTCFGPSVSISLVSVDLKTGSVTTGVMPGVGYGALFFADQWYRTGLAGYASFRDTANGQRMVGSVVGSFAEYLRAGLGRQFGPGEKFFLLLGIGAEFGSVPPAKP